MSTPARFGLFFFILVAGCSGTAVGTGTGQDGGSSGGPAGDQSGNPTGGPSDGTAPSKPAADGGGPGTTPAPAKLSVMIDGKSIGTTDAELWSNVTGPGEYDLFIKLSGPGYPSGSDISIHAKSIGSGCAIGDNSLFLRHSDGRQFSAGSTPGCGLFIDRLPNVVGGRIIGSFSGIVESLSAPTTTRSMAVTFDVPRTE